MGFRINTNIAAMNAHSKATMNNRNLDNSLEKLSSGLRINKAADDASGMLIANSLRNQANSLGQAIANANDGIGVIQTADGALDEYSKILDTIKTKSIQAASDGQNTSSRLAIQKDITRLMEELDMIATTTSFNGQKLLSGAFVNKEIQVGAYSNETVNMSIASAETDNVGHTTRANLNLASEQGGEVQLTMRSALTGQNVTMQSIDIQYNNDPRNGMGALADEINRHSGTTGIRAEAVVSSTSTATIGAGTTGSDFAINGIVIGSVQVEENDNSGTLLAAINGKATETGVSATKTEDGKLVLTANDGRAIEVTGDVTDVVGGTAKSMSTIGYIELVQSGASEFQVTGIGAGATGANITVDAGTGLTTVKDSILAAGSSIDSSSTIKAGSVVGGDLTQQGSVTTVLDANIKAGSTIISGSTFEAGTQIGGSLNLVGATAQTQDAFVTAGSTLVSGTLMDSGTVIQQDFTDNGVDYHKGDILTTDLTLTSNLTLTADMTINYDASAANSSIAAGSSLNTGSIVGADTISSSDMLVSDDMALKAGSTLLSGTIMKAGSELGGDTQNLADMTTSITTDLGAGSILSSGSILAKGSTIGGSVTVEAVDLTEDMLITAGSTLGSGTILKAGTVLQQDTTAAQTGVALNAGDVLTSDITTAASISLAEDMVLLKGEGATAGRIGDASVLNINTENSGTVGLSDAEYTNLADIDVTTFEGAMKAIDTLDAAITNLDTIRSDLGSVQNQLISTINNISVTQVNVKAAESQIRDVDFAAESANFSKYNILAQSGSYAMSQANAVQQNVLRLLQ